MNFAEFTETLEKPNQAIAKQLNDTLMSINPEYSSKKAWGGWGYLLVKNYSCLMVGYNDHLKLMIWRGVDLKDEQGILEGRGDNTRHIKFFSTQDVKEDQLKELLDQQFEMYKNGIKYEN